MSLQNSHFAIAVCTFSWRVLKCMTFSAKQCLKVSAKSKTAFAVFPFCYE
jgi:hypothetical protein